jgi:hypothetical protein
LGLFAFYSLSCYHTGLLDENPLAERDGDPMIELTWPQAAAWRMRRHHLVERAPSGSMLAVASRLCGLHAQVMSSAELTVWARVEGLDRQAVRRALWEERTLVKTWAMRGTLHLLPSSELPLWHAALGTSPRYLSPAIWKRNFGITLDDVHRLTEAVGNVLDGRLMTREELAREVAKLTGSTAFGSQVALGSWGTILKPAAFAGRLCFGPSIGQRVRFTLPATWVAKASQQKRSRTAAAVDPKEAQAAVACRFLTAYGPATYHDLGRWWGGGGVASAKQWIAALGEEVTAVDLHGTKAWMLTADVREAREGAPIKSVRLLPAFDQYVVGASRHADRLLPGDLRARVYRQAGWVSPVLLVNGLMQGVWRHEMKGSRIEVVIEPFIRMPAWVRRAAGQESERLAAFLGGKLNLTWKS